MNRGLALGRSLNPLLVQKAQMVATEMSSKLNPMKVLKKFKAKESVPLLPGGTDAKWAWAKEHWASPLSPGSGWPVTVWAEHLTLLPPLKGAEAETCLVWYKQSLRAGLAPPPKGDWACDSELSKPQDFSPPPPGGKGGTVSVSAGAASLVMNEVPGSIVCYFTVLCSEYPLHFAGPQTWPGVLRSGGAHRGNGIQSKWLLRVVRAVSECHSTWRKHIAVTPNPACGGQPQRSYSREGHWRWVCRIKTFQAEGTVWVDVWSSGNQRLSCVVFIFKFGNASQIFRGETL